MDLFVGSKISKSYSQKGFKLSDISFALGAGKIMGIVGENGNGKTTLLRIIAGDLSTDDGSLRYFDQYDKDNLDWLYIKQRVAYIPQRIPKWYGGLRDNLIFEASIHNIRGSKADLLIDNLVNQLGLGKYIHLQWKEISTGYRLRFQLAKMLINAPDLLVLDEPIANLDINAQSKFLEDLKRIVGDKERKISVVLSSQQLHEIENIADSILFLRDGKLIYGGEVDKIGEERTENEFEIQGDFDAETLQNIFEKIIVKDVANILQVKLPLEINAQVFLKAIVDQKLTISYFRDISSSTRKLFNQ